MTYINHSLLYQAMGYREAISDFRIRKPECAGSLFWMYSDCWGTLGWTIIDYYLRRKALQCVRGCGYHVLFLPSTPKHL